MGIVHIRTNANGEEVQFRPDAAASFRRVERDAGRRASVNRTVVAYDVQMDLYKLRQAGLYPFPVAHPDYSNHVYRSDTDGGNAWDTEERGDWLDEHGWIAVIEEEEPWHREYQPWRDKHINDPAPAGASETPEPEEEETMKALLIHIKHNDGTDPWYVVDYAAGTAAKMREGIQLDISRDWGGLTEVAGVQPESAIRGLTILNG